jgi:hypothetical protein
MTHHAVATADLADLARKGLTQAKIAAQVGLTRQGVAYRLRTARQRSVQPASVACVWYPRPIGPPPQRCAPCGRRVGRGNAKMGTAALLSEPSCCAYCARPLTDEAKARAPLAGYVALARVMARQPASVRAWRVAEVDA